MIPTLAFIMPSGAELALIACVVVLLFGAKKIPEFAKSLTQAVREFRKGTEDKGDDDSDGK